ncbi:uncharacterized protein LOC113236694 [Hyposmocoma kahamanoa]|uniref:uncharacterized protein LOC113236694 n=1 Tax=Hyposmocoma kahamanoa TaxID=1477025 RepID=UPI000E6D629B|nr:uncharacterized protein LOC113236694 [Hyposmocoma kahamanoa]
MMVTMKVLFVLAIAVTAILEVTSISPPTAALTKVNCSEPIRVAEINKTVHDVHACFGSLVRAEIGIKINETVGACESVDQFNTTAIKRFLNVTSQCETESANTYKYLSYNLNKFVKVVNRTLGDDRYKKFFENGGVMCVNEKKIEIQNCVRNNTFRNVTIAPQLYLTGFARMKFKQGCSEILGIKDCIAKEFQKSPKNCTEHSITYTNFLFDTVYGEFCKNRKWTNSTVSSSSRVVGAPVSIAVIIYFTILQFQ